ACEKGGAWQNALHLLSEMSFTRLRVSAVSIAAGMSASVQKSQWPLALRLFFDMLQDSIAADTVVYELAVLACADGGKSNLAVQLLNE
ncbi:unnamed protein product, partial [Symbiodinium necroappetens]